MAVLVVLLAATLRTQVLLVDVAVIARAVGLLVVLPTTAVLGYQPWLCQPWVGAVAVAVEHMQRHQARAALAVSMEVVVLAVELRRMVRLAVLVVREG